MVTVLDAIDRETMARLCYAANQPVGSVGLPFDALWPERRDFWMAFGDRVRQGIEDALERAEAGGQAP